MEFGRQVDTRTPERSAPASTSQEDDTLPLREEVDASEYSSDSPYDNFVEASVRYSMATTEQSRFQAAWRAIYYLSMTRKSAANGEEHTPEQPELFDLHLFNTAYTALSCSYAYRELAAQFVSHINDDDLRRKGEELLSRSRQYEEGMVAQNSDRLDGTGF